ncbi:uncharacterized protein LOC141813046 [Curcuma longa]|uniref:uncharacterized protein LOC141813046 n=1 Tax=Curcuma longa TaxID=136217 RepID=UPI003D9EB8E2
MTRGKRDTVQKRGVGRPRKKTLESLMTEPREGSTEVEPVTQGQSSRGVTGALGSQSPGVSTSNPAADPAIPPAANPIAPDVPPPVVCTVPQGVPPSAVPMGYQTAPAVAYSIPPSTVPATVYPAPPSAVPTAYQAAAAAVHPAIPPIDPVAAYPTPPQVVPATAYQAPPPAATPVAPAYIHPTVPPAVPTPTFATVAAPTHTGAPPEVPSSAFPAAPPTVLSSGFPAVPPMVPTPLVLPVPVANPTYSTDLTAARARIPALAEQLKSRFTLFRGGTDPRAAQSWLETVERTFFYTACSEWEKVELAAFHLRDEAEIWWATQRMVLGEQHVTWEKFREIFESQYFPLSYQMTRRQEFQSLQQKGRTVMEYNAEFNRLARFCPELVAEDRSRMLQFVQGLDGNLQVKIAGFGISSYREALDRALLIESAQQRAFGDRKRSKSSAQSSAQTQQPLTAGQQHDGRGDSSQIATGAPSKPQKSEQFSSKRSRFSRQDQRQSGSDSYCTQCGSRDHVTSACTLGQSVCYYCKLPGHMSRDCSLKAQHVSSGVSIPGGQFGQAGSQRGGQKAQSSYRQQRTAPPVAAAYGMYGQEHFSAPAISQSSVAGPQYQTQVQYPSQLQPWVQYQTQSQPPVQYQSQSAYQPLDQYPASPHYPPQWQAQIQPQQPRTALPPPPLPEIGRVPAVTREDAQRADGSVFHGTI